MDRWVKTDTWMDGLVKGCMKGPVSLKGLFTKRFWFSIFHMKEDPRDSDSLCLERNLCLCIFKTNSPVFMVWVTLAFWILIHLYFYDIFHFIANSEIIMHSCCLHSGGTFFKFMSPAVWKRLGVSVVGDSSPVSHQDLHSGHSWTSLDVPSPWDPMGQAIGKLWKGTVLGFEQERRCLFCE